MWSTLLAHLQSIDQTADIAAVVIQGAGGSFSAGADLTEVKHPNPEHVAKYRALAERAVLALMDLKPPKLAVIDGPCFGAACSIALACDVRICSPASQFGIPALRHGLTYEPTFIRRLVQMVGSRFGRTTAVQRRQKRCSGSSSTSPGRQMHPEPRRGSRPDPGFTVRRKQFRDHADNSCNSYRTCGAVDATSTGANTWI